MKIGRFVKQFNWRFLLVRILVNAIALAITALVVPKIEIVEMPTMEETILNWFFLAIMLGILNALVKPVLQFLTLQFLFVTYGLTIIVVNTLILLLLSILFPTRFEVQNLLWAFVGGLVLGLLSSFLESLLGLTMPIVSDEPPELREQLEVQARGVDWLAGNAAEADIGEQALITEPVVSDDAPVGNEGRPGEKDSEQASVPGVGESEPDAPEPDEQPASVAPVPSEEEAQLNLEEVPAVPTESEPVAVGETTDSGDAESVPDLQEDAGEGLS
jgi:putative membrane protein